MHLPDLYLSSHKLLLKAELYVKVSECVSVLLEDRLFQTQLAAPRHDGHLVFHVETHQVADTQKHLITGPHLGTQKHKTGSHVAFLFYPCTLRWKQTPPLYLSMRINQQQVTHNVSLHPTEDVLTRGRAALSDQEIPAAGEEGLRLLTSQPGMKDAKF